MHGLVHVYPLGRGAHLSGVEEGGEGDAACGDIDRGGRHDDEGVVAGGLGQRRLERARAGLRDGLRGLEAAREGHAIDAIVFDQPPSGGTPPRHALDKAGGQRRKRLHEQQRGQ